MEEDDDLHDIHICGRCDQHFTDYSLFTLHKKQHALSRKSEDATVHKTDVDKDKSSFVSNQAAVSYENASVMISETPYKLPLEGYDSPGLENGGDRYSKILEEPTENDPNAFVHEDGQLSDLHNSNIVLISRNEPNQSLADIQQNLDSTDVHVSTQFRNVIIEEPEMITTEETPVVCSESPHIPDSVHMGDNIVADSTCLPETEQFHSLADYKKTDTEMTVESTTDSVIQSDVEAGTKTLSAPGNIQITLTPSGLQFAVQSLPPDVQAALQTGLERGLSTPPALTMTYDTPQTVADTHSQNTPLATTAGAAPSGRVKHSTSNSQSSPGHKFSCDHEGCSFSTKYQKDLDRHIRTHTGEKPYSCTVCDKHFTRSDKLKLHMRGHEGVKPFRCTECSYSACDNSSLKKHLRIHTNERPFKCQICPYASRNSSQLIVHLRTHTGDSPYMCYICKAKFKISSDLKRHMLLHTGEKPYKCDLCSYKCTIKSNLKSHHRVNHSEENVIECASCEFRSSSRKAYKEHVKIHDPGSSQQCPHCSFTAKSKATLKIHLKTHKDDKPHQCRFCNFSAKQYGHVTKHMRRKHPLMRTANKKPESSEETETNTDVKQEPRRNKVSSLVRPMCKKIFDCPQCKSSFVREDSLRCHMKCHMQSEKMIAQSTALAVLQLQYPVDKSRQTTADDGPCLADTDDKTQPTDDMNSENAVCAPMTCYVVNSNQHTTLPNSEQIHYYRPEHSDMQVNTTEPREPYEAAMGSEQNLDRTSPPEGNVVVHSEDNTVSEGETGILHTALVQSNISDPLLISNTDQYQQLASGPVTQSGPVRATTRATMSQSAHQLLAYMQNSQNLAMEENMHNMAVINRERELSPSLDTPSYPETNRVIELPTQDHALTDSLNLVTPSLPQQTNQVIMEINPEATDSLPGHPVQLRPYIPTQTFTVPSGDTLDNTLIQNVQNALPVHVLQTGSSPSSAMPVQLLVAASSVSAATLATPLYSTSLPSSLLLPTASQLTPGWSLQIPVEADVLASSTRGGVSYQVITTNGSESEARTTDEGEMTEQKTASTS